MKKAFFAKSIVGAADDLTDRQVRVIASTGSKDRVNDVVEPQGCDLKSYVDNNVVLFEHDRKAPVGNADVTVFGDRVEALITFAPKGDSVQADEVCALAKAGVIKGVSIGYIALEFKALPDGGEYVTRWELLEISLVSVQANAEAIIVQRSLGGARVKCGASTSLPLVYDDNISSADAADSVLEQAGFDKGAPDSKWARKAFLLYDSTNVREKAAYGFPIAAVVDGRLTVVKSLLDEAEHDVSSSDLSDALKAKALNVIKAYRSKQHPLAGGEAPRMKIKGLRCVAQLAGALGELGAIQDWAAWETQSEGDDSKVPGMLADACRQVADTLVAMTQEEIAELLAGMAPDGTAGDTQSKSFGAKLKSIAQKAEAASQERTKSGKRISKATAEQIKSAIAAHGEAKAHADNMTKCYKKAMEDMCSLVAEPDEDDTSSGSDSTDKGLSSDAARVKRQLALIALGD